jgi:hypothetical protein
MPRARSFAPPKTILPSRRAVQIEPLETRALMSLTVQVDYTYDTGNFFDTPDKKTVLQAALDEAVSHYADHLGAITPGGGNTWKAILDQPTSGGTVQVSNLNVAADTLIVYVGAKSMSALGLGGPGGFNSTGTTDWNNTVATRGQVNTRGSDARDFGPYGGSISFDTDPAGGWYFGLDPAGIDGMSDFYSVALHEMTHLLGFGTADSWTSRVSGSLFTGPAAVGEYDGSGNVPLSGEHAHWISGTTDDGQETAMDPELTTGERKLLTALDLAAMDDVGWELPLTATLGGAGSVTAKGATSTNFTVTYSHYTAIDSTTIGTGDVTVTGPGGFSAPATLVGTSGTGKSITATYSLGAPGGSFDGSDSGTYTVNLGQNAVGDALGNFAPGGSLGSFVVDIDAPPIASFSAQNVTQLGASEHTFTVTYSDASGIDVATLGATDLTVTRASDGAALTVTGASVNTPGNGSPRTVTYTVAAPGGFWNASDNGTYNVVLGAGQVSDTTGTAADAGMLGTFDVAVQAVTFSAGHPATYTDASGDVVTVSLKGPGSGEVLFNATGNADASGMTVTGTTGASTITMSTKGAGTTLGGLTVSGSLKSITAKNTDFSGDFSVPGTLSSATFRNATGTMNVNGAGGPATSFTLAQAQDVGITSASPIKSVKAGAWLDTDATQDLITAPAIGSINVAGAFQANVNAESLAKFLAGDVSGDEIRASGDIGSVKVNSMLNVILFAGIRPDLSTAPTTTADFLTDQADVKSVVVKTFFDSSYVAAGGTIGKANLGTAEIHATTGLFGATARRINSGIAITFKEIVKVKKLQGAGQGQGLLDFFFRTL